MLCISRIIHIPAGKPVRKSGVKKIPPGKHGLYCADHIDEGSICPEICRSSNGRYPLLDGLKSGWGVRCARKRDGGGEEGAGGEGRSWQEASYFLSIVGVMQ